MLKYRRPLIVIEPGVPERLSPNAIYGALASLLSDYGINVVVLPVREGAALVARLAIREQLGLKREVGIVKKIKAWNDDDVRLRIISGFPGVSLSRAKRLLSSFGTLHNLFSCSGEQ